jgi:hypothetical protein
MPVPALDSAFSELYALPAIRVTGEGGGYRWKQDKLSPQQTRCQSL